MKRFVKIILSAVCTAILFLACLVFIIPDDFIGAIIKEKLQSIGIVIKEQELKKALPFGIEMKGVYIFNENSEKPILIFDELKASLNLLHLFLGKGKIAVYGNKGSGCLNADILFKKGGIALNLSAKNIKAATISYLDIDNLGNAANFSGKANIFFQKGKCPFGNIDLDGKDIDIKGFSISGFHIYQRSITTAALSAELKECKVNIKSLWLEDKDISASIKGNMSLINPYIKSPIALTLEIMPKASFNEAGDNYLLPLIANYHKSKNYYLIKVGGTIENPIIS